jgi:hypothetical protein
MNLYCLFLGIQKLNYMTRNSARARLLARVLPVDKHNGNDVLPSLIWYHELWNRAYFKEKVTDYSKSSFLNIEVYMQLTKISYQYDTNDVVHLRRDTLLTWHMEN